MTTHLKDMPGKRVGKLTVIRRVESNKHGHPMFLCKCDCGRDHVTAKSNLTRAERGTKSCGCLLSESKTRLGDYRAGGASRKQLETIYPDVPSRLQQRVCNIKKNMKHRRKSNELRDDQILWLVLKPCKYCDKQDIENGIGIDRVDPKLGYSFQNSVPCCKNCNFAKNTMTVEEFKQWLARAYQTTVLSA